MIFRMSIGFRKFSYFLPYTCADEANEKPKEKVGLLRMDRLRVAYNGLGSAGECGLRKTPAAKLDCGRCFFATMKTRKGKNHGKEI